MMDLEMKVEVIHRERIRPISPTPHHLRVFSLSVFDQFSPAVHFPLLLFYPNNIEPSEVNNIDPQCSVVERTKLLKRSLSDTLTRFYPFAGTIHDHASICCNDQGAVFLEAQVNCSMSRVLNEPDLELLKELIPKLESISEGETGYDLLNIQANFFECGGIAIGFHVSHKMIDAYTLSKFINSWAAATSLGFSTSDHNVVLPSYQYLGAASHYPPLALFEPPPQFGELAKEKCITKRFMFESSKIACLKSEAASAAVKNPTRVEVVSALIWKTAMRASSANSCSVRPSSTWLQIVNMRNIITQPSAENLMGNLLGFYAATSTREGERNDDLQGLVAAMRKGSEELKVKYGTKCVSGEDVSKLLIKYGEQMQKNDVECYCSTSWCRFPFYKADFGWGKPLMSIPATIELKNLITLMDTSDGGGIEVRLTLKEEDMAMFENNEELLAYASINPTLT
ncbi:stemmadenine O-acetyltransferase-like [Argentina anserina]|uniref:stemmadenine O-acetyltransferase-like n=1 Tax=Argentina anserina TaxID=57926 RepID=UPI0021762D4C|nr:stemmadenine O-acetyltransferase-like [Potentilla anserina]